MRFHFFGAVRANLGFGKVFGGRRPQAFDLWLIACKQKKSDPDMRRLAAEHLPERS